MTVPEVSAFLWEAAIECRCDMVGYRVQGAGGASPFNIVVSERYEFVLAPVDLVRTSGNLNAAMAEALNRHEKIRMDRYRAASARIAGDNAHPPSVAFTATRVEIRSDVTREYRPWP